MTQTLPRTIIESAELEKITSLETLLAAKDYDGFIHFEETDFKYPDKTKGRIGSLPFADDLKT